MTKRILFVDDEPSIRSIYEMLPAVLEPHFSVETSPSAEDALTRISAGTYDVVVSDLVMPGMSGADLLSRVAKISPESARVVVSGFADELTIAKCLLAGHRYFTKPFDPIALTDSLATLEKARTAVASGKIREIVGRMESLPTPSDTYLQIMKALNNPHTPVSDIAMILENDPSLSAKVLQAVNSAMFGAARRIVSVCEALQLIGLQVLRALVLTIQVFDFYRNPELKRQLQRIWKHSSNVAQRARAFASANNWPANVADESFFAALLHDIGRVVLIASPDAERQALFPEYCATHDDFSPGHALSHAIEAEAGSYLLSLWGIPESIVSAVRTFRSSLDEPQAVSAAAALGIAHHLELLAKNGACL